MNGDSCHVVAVASAVERSGCVMALLPVVMLEVENVSNELDDPAKSSCSQSGRDVTWFLLAANNKMQEKRKKLKKRPF